MAYDCDPNLALQFVFEPTYEISFSNRLVRRPRRNGGVLFWTALNESTGAAGRNLDRSAAKRRSAPNYDANNARSQ